MTREEKQAVREQIKATKDEMKRKGIRRFSCFNGGHSTESYELNARLFKLESRLRTA